MTTQRVLSTALAGMLAVVAACAGSDDELAAPETTDVDITTTQSAPDSTATTVPPTAVSTVPPTTASTVPELIEVPDDWAEQLLAAFDTYDRTRKELDEETSRELGEIQPDAEQEFFDVLAELDAGLANAGDVLTASLPSAVPADVAPPFNATRDALEEIVDQLRASSDGLFEGDPGPYNEREPFFDAFNTACAELQFTMLDIGAGQLACGIRGGRPDERAFVEGPTVDSGNDEFVEMPAGEYELDYIISDNPDNPNPDLVIGLAYEQDRLIRSSITVLEVADTEDGPSIRLFTNELVASPLDLAPDRIRDFWPNTDGPEGWVGALDGVVVTETGEGEISGIPAEYWVLVSELDAPIAVLGDGEGWVPETTLDPGQPVRLWSVILDDHPLILTEHVPPGATLDEFAEELSALRAGLTLAIG